MPHQHKSRIFFKKVFIISLLWSASGLLLETSKADAQDLLGLLTGGSSKKTLRIETIDKQAEKRLRKQFEAAKKRIEDFQKKMRLHTEKTQKTRKQLERNLRRLAPKSGNAQTQGWRDQLRMLLERNIVALNRLSSAHSSHEQNLTSLRSTVEEHLSARTRLRKELQEQYVKPRHVQDLSNAITRIKQALHTNRSQRNESHKELQQLRLDIDKAQTSMDAARRKLIYGIRLDLLRTLPRPRPAPVSRPTTSTSRPTSRPSSQNTTPPPPRTHKLSTPTFVALQWKERFLRARFLFQQIHMQWLSIRKQDEELDLEIASQRHLMLSFKLEKMQEAYTTLSSRTQTGLLFRRRLQLDLSIGANIRKQVLTDLRKAPGHLRDVYNNIRKEFQGQSTSTNVLFVFLFVLFFIALIFAAVTTRRILQRSIDQLSQRKEAGTVTRQLWHTFLLVFRGLRALIPFGAFVLLLFALLWYLPFPVSWEDWLLSLCIILLVLRISFSLIHQLFSPRAEERYFASLDDNSAGRFRLLLKSFGLFALVFLSLHQLLTLLKYPANFLLLLNIVFYTVLVGSCVLLLLNKDGILSMFPADNRLGRLLILLFYRFYPWFFLLILALYGLYVWGYVNLAAYLTTGITLTILLAGFVAGITRLVWVASLWAFGFSKGEGGLVNLERRWARSLMRFSRAFVGFLLALVSLSLLFEIWGFAGFRAISRLFRHPFLQVQETQINVISIIQLTISITASIWLSRFARRKLRENVYPALRISPPNQHAANTVLGYIIIAVGLLVGLQWIGIGISVLAVFAGILGIGIGFGLQNIMSNFISGLIITFGQPIKVGDLIEVGGVLGEVKEISARSTTIETYDFRIILIPNSEILTTKVINWSLGPPYVAVKLAVGVAYGSDVPLVKQTLYEIAQAHPLVLANPPVDMRFSDFGNNSLDFSLWVAVANPLDRFRVLSDLRYQIDTRFRELGIVIAFPQRDLHLNPNLEEALIQNFSRATTPTPPFTPRQTAFSFGVTAPTTELPVFSPPAPHNPKMPRDPNAPATPTPKESTKAPLTQEDKSPKAPPREDNAQTTAPPDPLPKAPTSGEDSAPPKAPTSGEDSSTQEDTSEHDKKA